MSRSVPDAVSEHASQEARLKSGWQVSYTAAVRSYVENTGMKRSLGGGCEETTLLLFQSEVLDSRVHTCSLGSCRHWWQRQVCVLMHCYCGHRWWDREALYCHLQSFQCTRWVSLYSLFISLSDNRKKGECFGVAFCLLVFLLAFFLNGMA